MMEILLDGNWNLVIAENCRVERDHFEPKRICDFDRCGYLTVSGTVPGNFELDLVRAGILDDPYFGTNVLKMQDLENRHCWYYRRFNCDFADTENSFLVFDGIDTVAEIWLNGCLVGKCENMLIGHEFVAKGLQKGENELVVHILPAVIYSRKFEIPPFCSALPYNYDALYLRKAQHSFGWDIMPRIVSAGIWKSVRLIQRKKEYLEDVYLHTVSVSPENKANICAFFSIKTDRDSLKGLRIELCGTCGDSRFSAETDVWHTYGRLKINAENVRCWMPIGYGEPNLYEVLIRLLRDGTVIDEKQILFGVRTVELERTSTATVLGDGKFLFKINHEPIFVLGTNWVPLDAFHSNDINRVDRAIELLCECGCNLARVWGGGVYESDRFYELCDRKGIMVWQDFAMACSVYPQNERFFDAIRTEAVSVVKRLRNHASLILWAGDNECDYTHYWNGIDRNPNKNRITRKILPEVLEQQDMVRPYLPSSPYVDEEAFRTELKTPEDHPWGPRNYFKSDYYKNMVCSFASEIGYHGCPSPESLKKFISYEQLFPIMKNRTAANDDWHIHASNPELNENAEYAYRINLMYRQIGEVFTETPNDLVTFAKMSQIVQAEAKKYFIEKFRIAKGKTSGIIWWNLLDGWPQISDAVVDYYYTPKLAYWYIARSQKKVCMMFDEPKDGKINLYAVNDGAHPAEISYRVTDVTCGNILVCEGVCMAPSRFSVAVHSVDVPSYARFYRIDWSVGSEKGSNHYMTETRHISYEEYLKAIESCGYDEFSGFGA